jgi:hypothetical protein
MPSTRATIDVLLKKQELKMILKIVQGLKSEWQCKEILYGARKKLQTESVI